MPQLNYPACAPLPMTEIVASMSPRRGGGERREVREIAPTHALTEAHWRTQEIADDLRAALEQIEDVLGDLQARVPHQK